MEGETEMCVRFDSVFYSQYPMCARANTVRSNSMRGRMCSVVKSFGLLIILLRPLPAGYGCTIVKFLQIYFQPWHEFSIIIRRSKCQSVPVMDVNGM